ncbi:unnamed protein product [Clonostachys byssicola]|uniref:Uncharacterized protein n=1 Tax=Clonostachys byssicola TaxID=160290 RepID=A0A9N9XUM8_9HYPO|nr:unnamed protein product [Clonostachys byssicola]
MKSGLLDPKWKFREHIIQLILVTLVIILCGVYLSMPGVIPVRSEIMAIPFSVKSIVIIAYQLLTEHTQRFSKWASTKANAILNCLETVFWLTLIVLKFMGISRTCTGGSCGVNVFLTLVIMVVFVLTVHVAVLSVIERRNFKRYGK